MNLDLGRHSKGSSPAHTLPHYSTSFTPTRHSSKRKARSKRRPMSMIEPHSYHKEDRTVLQDNTEDLWGDDSEDLFRSTSVSEVQRPTRIDKVLSKEAP